MSTPRSRSIVLQGAPPAAGQVRLALLASVLTLLGLLTLSLPSALTGQDAGVGLPVGSAAPDVALEDLDGNPVQLSDYLAGKPTLLEFWATWCENCEALQPQMDAVQARYGERVNVVAVAVAVSQSQRRVKRHLEDHDPGYPFLWDGRGAAVRAFQAATTSIVILVDAQGKVAYTGVGGGQDLVGAVERLLGSDAPGA